MVRFIRSFTDSFNHCYLLLFAWFYIYITAAREHLIDTSDSRVWQWHKWLWKHFSSVFQSVFKCVNSSLCVNGNYAPHDPFTPVFRQQKKSWEGSAPAALTQSQSAAPPAVGAAAARQAALRCSAPSDSLADSEAAAPRKPAKSAYPVPDIVPVRAPLVTGSYSPRTAHVRTSLRREKSS